MTGGFGVEDGFGWPAGAPAAAPGPDGVAPGDVGVVVVPGVVLVCVVVVVSFVVVVSVVVLVVVFA